MTQLQNALDTWAIVRGIEISPHHATVPEPVRIEPPALELGF